MNRWPCARFRGGFVFLTFRFITGKLLDVCWNEIMRKFRKQEKRSRFSFRVILLAIEDVNSVEGCDLGNVSWTDLQGIAPSWSLNMDKSLKKNRID